MLSLFALVSAVSTASAQTLSDDASLSDLSLSGGRLSPAFASGTTMYTASVGYTVERVTVTAAKSDDSATVSFLDTDGLPLVDADTVAGGQQVDLAVGVTVVKVKVTAQDTITTETYTVTITRTEQDMSLWSRVSDPVAAHASSARYTVTFQGAWTSAVTPVGVPGGAHFSRLVGGVHNAAAAFVESGERSSAGVEAMAEVGGWTGLRDEVVDAGPDALSVLVGDTDFISPTGSKSLTAALTTEHPRVTLVTMIAPSHDWFVGVSGLPLVDSEGRWLGSHTVSLYPWDAGTEDGTDFSLSPSVATSPQGTIESLRGTGLFTTEPIATLSFTLNSAVTTRSVAEDTAAGTDIGGPVALGGTSGPVAYTLGGTDAASFDIAASTGQLRTKAALDYETKSSYTVTVTATDSNGAVVTTVAIKVTNAVELASTVTGAASVDHAENGAGRVTTYTASSPVDRDGIEWSLSGDDAAHFSIDEPAGALRFHIDPVSPNIFAKPPDYESPSDSDTDNDYEVTLTASLAGSSTSVTQAVTVTVTDTDEAGTLTLSTTRPQMGTALTATLNDPDGVVDGTPTYAWERSTSPNTWATITAATSSTYTPTAADTGTFLRATATYEDGHSTGNTATALTYEVVTASLLTGLLATTNDSTANPDRALSPAFSADTLHYALGCAAGGDTMTVTPTAATGVRIAVDGIQVASGTAATVTVNRESDVHVTLTGADGAATTYVVHCHIHRERMIEATKTPGADGILEELIMLRFYDSVAIVDNNAVPRFRRVPGHGIWAYFRVDRVAGADQQQGDELEYRYSYVDTSAWPHFEFTVLDQSLEILDTGITTVSPLETIDLHDFRILPNGNYLLMAYEPAMRDLSGLSFDHPDIVDSQPQAVRDAAVQIVTPAGRAVFTWNSWEIMPLEDCTQHRFAAEEDHSYAHINSLQMVDGLVIASLRGCSKVLAIDPNHAEDHKVAWRVGRSNLTAEQWEVRDVGPAPMSIIGDPVGEFCAQHAAQILPNGNLLLFDNGVHCVVNPLTGEFVGRTDDDYYSRGVEYALDHRNGEAVFVRDHSLRGTRQYIGNSQGQIEPLANGDWLISWGRASRSVAPDDPEVPIEAVTQVDPDTGDEKFSLSERGSPLTNFRAIPLHPKALFAAPEPLAAVFPVSSHTSRATEGPADRPTVVVAFNQPVVDPAAATASVSVAGATVESVSPHVVAGEAANAYIFTLTPTGHGSITFSLVAGQPCDPGDTGGVCTADGRTLSAVPDPHRIAATPQPSPEAQTAAALVKNTDKTASPQSSGFKLDAEEGPIVAAQGFTTGSNHDGYALSSIGVGFQTISDTSTAGRELTASLHDAATVPGGIVGPGPVLCTLNDPANFSSSGLHHFTAPTSGTGLCPTLEPSTRYFVSVQRELVDPIIVNNTISIYTTDLCFDTTDSCEADSGAAVGWSLDEGLVYVDPEIGSVSSDVWTFATANIQVEVRGALYPISRSVTENTAPDRDIGPAVAFIEPDGGALTYTLDGDDADSFDIVDSTGQLRTKTALDHESKSSYEVTVTVTNPSGVSAENTVDIGVTDINEAPVVSGGTVFSFAENDPATETVGVFTAVDPDAGDSVEWSLSAPGSDEDLFSITGGVLEFLASPDFESRVDAQGRHVYELVVEATDGGGLTGTLAVSVSVENVNEKPAIDEGPDTATVEEGDSGVFATYRAIDPDNDSVEWSLSGADAALFEISGGSLGFRAAPDFEARADAGGDNVYEVVVVAGDGEFTATLAVLVTVTNDDEPGAVSLSAVQPQAGEALAASLSDPDEVVASSLNWQWQASLNRVSWSPIDGAVSSSYTPAGGDGGDVDRYLRAVASYSDGHGPAKQALAVSQNPVQAAPVINQPPTFASGTVARSVAENAAVGSPVGDPVTAADLDPDILTYSMTLTSGVPFEIVPATGQMRTTAALDHETADSHTVFVTATDPSGASTTVQVDVEVNDVNEAPVVSGAQIERFTENGTGDVATFTASDPDDGDTVTWGLAGADAGLFSIAGGALSFNSPPDYDRPADRGRDNGYEVEVTATDSGGLQGTLQVVVKVENVNEAPVIAGHAAVNVPEPRRTVATYTADDPEGVTAGWSLAGADADADLFTIDGGRLSFNSPPDFETPADHDDNNDYHVTVEATDGTSTSRLDVTVTVTDTDENRPQSSIGVGGGSSSSAGGGPSAGGGSSPEEAGAKADLFYSGPVIEGPEFCLNRSLGGPVTYPFDSDGDGVADICSLPGTRRAAAACQNALGRLGALSAVRLQALFVEECAGVPGWGWLCGQGFRVGCSRLVGCGFADGFVAVGWVVAGPVAEPVAAGFGFWGFATGLRPLVFWMLASC